LWWLNDPRNGMFPGAPNSAFCAMGVGSQIIYIDPENELVIVARWIEKDQMPEFIRMVLASIEN
jgi:CubicO group peptidase (beta-lactamase class C family)